WGIGAGVAVALVDLVTRELARITHEPDLATALDTLDLAANFGLFGWAGYRAAQALREFRPGLEAAVLAGVVTGVFAVVYNVVRYPDILTGSHVVQLMAWNIIYASLGGVMGAWLGCRAGSRPPTG
ncbi:MAG: hypothetical protein IRZ14_08100, partial [Chloroflexi bacterium]|nr:hypothetical protein [Chloroflexota bacterium]